MFHELSVTCRLASRLCSPVGPVNKVTEILLLVLSWLVIVCCVDFGSVVLTVGQ